MYRGSGHASGLEVTESGLHLPEYDYIKNTPTTTSDSYVFRYGGAVGTVVAQVDIVYTDTTKATIDTVTRVI